MTTQGRRRRAEEPEGTPERDSSGRTAQKGRAGRPKLEPMQINEAKVIWIGIGLWAAAFLILLPFRSTLISDGHGWWLYTCLAGAGLGMVGLPMVGRRKAVMVRETERGRDAGRTGGRDARDARDVHNDSRGDARDDGRDAGREDWDDRDDRDDWDGREDRGGRGGRSGRSDRSDRGTRGRGRDGGRDKGRGRGRR